MYNLKGPDAFAKMATIPEPDTQALELVQARTDILLGEFTGIRQLETEDQYSRAGELARIIASLKAEVESAFKPTVEAAHLAHKTALSAMKKQVEPLDSGRAKINALMSDYMRRKQAAQREAEAERARLERERREALVAASVAESAGDAETTQALCEVAQDIERERQAVAMPVPDVKGVTARTVWKWRMLSLDAIPRQYLMVDETKISGVVKALKGDHGITGIEAYEDSVIVVRR